MAGLPAPPATASSEGSIGSPVSSRESSAPASKQDEDLIAFEAENIVRKGEQEKRFARRGAFSERPAMERDGDSVYNFSSQASSREPSPERGRHRLSQVSLASETDADLTPIQKQTSWSQQSSKMTARELLTANDHLLNRLRPFMANPLMNSPVKAFFYNDTTSADRSVDTDPSGHFRFRAELDFVPTNVRVWAGQNLSATEEVTVTSPKGVSLISDIDDTIKHTAINDGARAIFRNTFTRELGDLTIDGVREWYNTMHDMGVQLHYVSNSPWQIYPALTTFFKFSHLPNGSFHLRQYTGVLQGIFEPVAERKKPSLAKIMRDFPDRKFVLVGDSGEADLEVYTDVALDYPGRVLGIFIRDVTTAVNAGYFDPSNGTSGGGRQHSRHSSRHKSTDSLAMSKRLSRPGDIRDDDADLRVAIAASLADVEAETHRARMSINPDSPSPENIGTPRPKLPPPRRTIERSITQSPDVASPEEDLIDFMDEPTPTQELLTPSTRTKAPPRKPSANGLTQSRPMPSPPPKPQALRSPSPGGQRPSASPESSSKLPPPRPRKPSSAVKPPSPQQIQTWTSKPPLPQLPIPASQHQPSPLSQVSQLSPDIKSRPQLPARPTDSGTSSKGLATADRAVLPATYWQSDATVRQTKSFTPSNYAESLRMTSTASIKSVEGARSVSSSAAKAAPPLPPPRLRKVNSYTTTAKKAANRLSGGWDDGSGGSLPGTPTEAGVSKKEFLWNQRWARAHSRLDPQGVTLRTWRVGSDVADVCVRLVEHALRDIEKEKQEQGSG